MHHDNDNISPSAERVMEIRPSPEELNRILHRRFPGMGPPTRRQLDEAARRTFNADFSKWLGLDGRWHSCGEQYRQPKGGRRVMQTEGVAMGGQTMPSVGGRQIRFDAAEDAAIALIDAKRAPPVAANDNDVPGRRRRSRRRPSRNAAIR
ncbi:hypothetical protein [Bradyrhizobium glycinis]|uniref:hypothetical protein n=1 Tax=Bradyrhizobium glycinis TaxID=2751812 RepID=UPI0018D9D706|nr:hypothetical protein [Bradyrhizobium glycinis]MBH5371480.1 hypothetical protein [Bradyrhizobium glycinis]